MGIPNTRKVPAGSDVLPDMVAVGSMDIDLISPDVDRAIDSGIPDIDRCAPSGDPFLILDSAACISVAGLGRRGACTPYIYAVPGAINLTYPKKCSPSPNLP